VIIENSEVNFKLINFIDVFQIINMYFPKRISYDILAYRNSPEFLNRIKKIEEAKLNTQYSTYLYLSVKTIFSKFKVVNWTEVETFNCYEYRILLHENQSILDDDTDLMKVLKGRKMDLFLFISVLGRYYYFFTNETLFNEANSQWKFKKVFNYPKSIKKEIEGLETFFCEEGYYKIDNSIAHEIATDIETEVIEQGKVKVFNCLFTDLISI
jgi:hypothetical protein